MNVWARLLTYWYSGIALGALIQARGDRLFFTNDDAEQTAIRESVVVEATKIGDLMASNIEANIVGSYNQHIIGIYEQQRKKAEAAVEGA